MRVDVSAIFFAGWLLFVAALASATAAKPGQGDWPQWRGSSSDNKASSVEVPLRWGDGENIVWQISVPGRGHSSPIVRDNYVFLTTADEKEQVQSVLAFDRETGRPIWNKPVFHGGFDERVHRRNSQASSSIACSRDRLFATFLNDGAIWILAFDFEGNELWRKRIGEFTSNWGYSASPTLYKSMVLVAADDKDGGFLDAVDQSEGQVIWSVDRPKIANYASPIVHRVSGQDQLLLAGCDRFCSYAPDTGKLLWDAPGPTEECVGTIVVDNDLAFASGGYPKQETLAVRTDGSSQVAWQNNVKVYVPSMLAHDGLLYAVTDNGVAYCWDAASGDERWKHRFGGTFNASSVLLGSNIVATAEDGTSYVFAAKGEGCEVLAKNKLGDEVYATPTFCGDHGYIRFAKINGEQRQEFLACIGNVKP